MRTLKIFILSLLTIVAVEAKSQSPSGFPSPYSTNWYRVGFLQSDSGLIMPLRDTTVRSRFAGLSFLWQHSGSDSSNWLFNGNRYVKQLNSQDTLPGRFLVTPSFLASQAFLKNITGFIQQGTNVTITGSGTIGSPYVINASGSTSIDSAVNPGLFLKQSISGSTKTFFADSSFATGLSGYYLRRIDTSAYVTPTQLSTGLASKQGIITLGTTVQYFRGDLSLATFPTNLSAFTNGPGYITGNQSISFTASGDINGTYTSPTVLTPTLTINANAVTYSKFQQAVGQGLLGAQSAGNYGLITLGSGLIMSGSVLSATGSGGSSGVDTLWRTPGKDSIQYTIQGRYHSILDSASGSGGSGITQLTGDGTAGPGSGSQVFTLATVNSNIGTFGSVSSVAQITLNGKGLTTAASSVSIQIIESQVTNLTTDLAGKQTALSGTGYVKFAGTTPSYLTPTQVTADLNIFNTSLQGLVPLSGGGTTNFLRADGTWAAPSGGGAVSSVSNSDGTVTISPTTGAVVVSLALSHANTWITNAQTFNGGLALGSNVTFATDNTYSIGTASVGANVIYSRFLGSDGILSLETTGSNPIIFAPNSANKMQLAVSGQLQLGAYTTSTSFTGTSVAVLATDASGNIIQTSLSGLSGTGYVFQTGGSTSYINGASSTLMGFNTSGTAANITLGSGLNMVGSVLSSTGGVSSGNGITVSGSTVNLGGVLSSNVYEHGTFGLQFDTISHIQITNENTDTNAVYITGNQNGHLGLTIRNYDSAHGDNNAYAVLQLQGYDGRGLQLRTITGGGDRGFSNINCTSPFGFVLSGTHTDIIFEASAIPGGGSDEYGRFANRSHSFGVTSDGVDHVDTVGSGGLNVYGGYYEGPLKVSGQYNLHDRTLIMDDAGFGFTIFRAGNYQDKGYSEPVGYSWKTIASSSDTVHQSLVLLGTTGYAGLGGVVSPTAQLELAASTTAAGTSQIKFDVGTPMTTPEAGALFNGPGYRLEFARNTTTWDSIAYLADIRAATGLIWNIGGNAVATSGNLGTTTNFGLVFITNNAYRGEIFPGGDWIFGGSATDNGKAVQIQGTSSIAGNMTLAGNVGFLGNAGNNWNNFATNTAPNNIGVLWGLSSAFAPSGTNKTYVRFGGDVAFSGFSADTVREIVAFPAITSAGGSHVLIGFESNPTLTSTTGLTQIDFLSHFGNNVFNNVSGTSSFGLSNFLSSARIGIGAATSTISQINLASSSGTNPASPNDGDLVYDGTHLNFRHSGTTTDLLAGGGGGTSPPFADNAALVKNNADNTKLLILSAASITTATTRIWTFPDANGTVARIDAGQTFTGNNTFSGTSTFSGGKTLFAAATTSYASINLPSGTLPTSPVTGDFSFDGTHLYFFNGTANKDLLAATNAFVFGGNSFGSNATIGTIDNFNLAFATDNAYRGGIFNDGHFLIGSSGSDPTSLFRVEGTSQLTGNVTLGAGIFGTSGANWNNSAVNNAPNNIAVNWGISSGFVPGGTNRTFFKISGDVSASGTTADTVWEIPVNATINNTGLAHVVVGYDFNPIATSLTGTTLIAFRNQTGNNLFNSTSGITSFGSLVNFNATTSLWKWNGLSQDTTNTMGVEVAGNDSSERRIPWAKFATKLSGYLPTFNIFPANGLTGAGGDSVYLGGTLNQNTTIAQSNRPLTFSGGQDIFGNISATREWAPSNVIPGSIFSMLSSTLQDTLSAASATVTNSYVFGISTPTFSALNSSVTYTNAYTLFVNGGPVAGTNATITNPYALGVIGNSLLQGSVTITGLLTAGSVNIYGKNDLTGQTGAVGTVTSYAVPGSGSFNTFRVGGYIVVTAVSLDVIQLQVTWTDETSTSRTQSFFVQGATTGISATGANAYSPMDIRVKQGTTVTVATVLTTGTGSITYDVGANITQLY